MVGGTYHIYHNVKKYIKMIENYFYIYTCISCEMFNNIKKFVSWDITLKDFHFVYMTEYTITDYFLGSFMDFKGYM